MDVTRHIRVSAVTETVEAAFAFALTAIEDEGIDVPVISVDPMMLYVEGLDDGAVRYDVVVSGEVTTEEPGTS